jgi:plasmid replication initiation protein
MEFKAVPEFIMSIFKHELKKVEHIEDFVEGSIKITKTKDGVVIEIVDFEANAMFRTSDIPVIEGDTITLQDFKVLTGVNLS